MNFWHFTHETAELTNQDIFGIKIRSTKEIINPIFKRKINFSAIFNLQSGRHQDQVKILAGTNKLILPNMFRLADIQQANVTE